MSHLSQTARKIALRLSWLRHIQALGFGEWLFIAPYSTSPLSKQLNTG
jgi:hypothetical protein